MSFFRFYFNSLASIGKLCNVFGTKKFTSKYSYKRCEAKQLYEIVSIIYYILYYIILYYTILNYIILYYIKLYYTILYPIILCYVILYYIILCYIILYYIIFYSIILYFILLCNRKLIYHIMQVIGFWIIKDPSFITSLIILF